MLPDLKLVIRLQDIDNRLAELAREIASLPKHVAEIEKKLVSHERKLEADRAALAGQSERAQKVRRRYPGSGAEDLEVERSDAQRQDQ